MNSEARDVSMSALGRVILRETQGFRGNPRFPGNSDFLGNLDLQCSSGLPGKTQGPPQGTFVRERNIGFIFSPGGSGPGQARSRTILGPLSASAPHGIPLLQSNLGFGMPPRGMVLHDHQRVVIRVPPKQIPLAFIVFVKGLATLLLA